jgi:hypothetical protein
VTVVVAMVEEEMVEGKEVVTVAEETVGVEKEVVEMVEDEEH